MSAVSQGMPYRDDVDHLKRRLASVHGELAEVRQKTQSLEELQRHAQALEDEAAELQRELASRERHRTLPLLDSVRVASPCEASWDEMLGDERKRFCAHCAKNVYNLSAMKRAEAEELLQRSEGKLCVRFYRRTDGTVLTEDCPVGVRRRRRRWVAVTALAVGGLLGVGAAFFRTHGERVGGVEVGDVAMPVETGTAVPLPPISPASEPSSAYAMGTVVPPAPSPAPPKPALPGAKKPSPAGAAPGQAKRP